MSIDFSQSIEAILDIVKDLPLSGGTPKFYYDDLFSLPNIDSLMEFLPILYVESGDSVNFSDSDNPAHQRSISIPLRIWYIRPSQPNSNLRSVLANDCNIIYEALKGNKLNNTINRIEWNLVDYSVTNEINSAAVDNDWNIIAAMCDIKLIRYINRC